VGTLAFETARRVLSRFLDAISDEISIMQRNVSHNNGGRIFWVDLEIWSSKSTKDASERYRSSSLRGLLGLEKKKQTDS
jgi:hypothetical protein